MYIQTHMYVCIYTRTHTHTQYNWKLLIQSTILVFSKEEVSTACSGENFHMQWAAYKQHFEFQDLA